MVVVVVGGGGGGGGKEPGAAALEDSRGPIRRAGAELAQRSGEPAAAEGTKRGIRDLGLKYLPPFIWIFFLRPVSARASEGIYLR